MLCGRCPAEPLPPCHSCRAPPQKLHTNTTPEDVTICEAYLAFLRSNDMGEFW